MKALTEYTEQLKNLHINTTRGFRAPYKPILLITISELIRDGLIASPQIVKNEVLKKAFAANWYRFIQINTPFSGDIDIPFRHMSSEKFVSNSNASDYFTIDEELYEYLTDQEISENIIALLISTYLAPFAYQHKVNFSELNPYHDKTLRPYQMEGKEKIYRMWTQLRSIMFQMPTGTGKTKLFVSIARDLFDWGAAHRTAVKILFLAHRIELIDQISENLGIRYNLAHGLIASRNREQKIYPLQVGSVQTLIRRLDRWEDKDFDFIIIDEAHHVKAESYKKILRAFPTAKVLGVTATPYRMSHESFRPEFDELITSMPVSKFIKLKWLCDYDYYSIRPESKIQLDIDSINRLALDGDYLDEASAAIMDKDEIRAGIVSTYMKYANGKKGIVYTITKEHNRHVCSQFVEQGYKAVAIDDTTPPEQRKQYVEDFRKGKIEIICNVNIFSEGFDCPDLEFIQLARPTKSLSMYLQQVGRGLRPAEGKKKLIILDNVGLYNRFGFPSARRQWRRHFEGHDFDYSDPTVFRSTDGRIVSYIDDYEEGDEDVEMLHSTEEEPTESTFLDTLPEKSTKFRNEAEFRFYMTNIKISEDEIKRIIRGIKVDVDNIIRGKYDSKHTSIFNIDEKETIELYLDEFQVNPIMQELDTAKHGIMKQGLATYLNYLNWRETDNAETDSCTQQTDEEAPRSLEEVELEIRILQKWNKDIPEELLREYHSLKPKLN